MLVHSDVITSRTCVSFDMKIFLPANLCTFMFVILVGCSAPNCHNRSEKGIRLFSFPTDKDRRNRWLVNCRRENWVPTSTSRLCEEHFESSQYENKRTDGWRKLKSTAVPTIFPVPNPPPVLQSKQRVLKRRFVDDDDSAMKAQRVPEEHGYDKSPVKEENSEGQNMVNCSVTGCHNSLAKSQLRFFRFPSDSRRRELWKAFTKRENLLPKYPRICEVHFDTSQFELKRQDGWRKLKWTAVPTLHPSPPSDHQLGKEQEEERLTERQLDTSLKLTGEDGEEFHNGASEASTDMDAPTHVVDQQEIETKTKKLGTSGGVRESGKCVIRDRRFLHGLLKTTAENIRKFSYQLQDATNRKSLLMQAVNALTQEEIALQRRLKRESDKENDLKQQLQNVEDAEKDLWKAEELCSEELDALMEQNHHQNTTKEDWKQWSVEEQCSKELDMLIQNDSHLGSQVSAQNDLIAKNVLRETSAANQIEFRLFDSFVAFSIVDNIQFATLQLESDKGAHKSIDTNPDLHKNATNLTDPSEPGQGDDLTLFAESSPTEMKDRVERNSFDQATNQASNDQATNQATNDQATNQAINIQANDRATNAGCGVEASSLGTPPMWLRRNHVCSFCGSRFWNAGARHSHELTHGKEFRCNVCDKVFSYRGGLINHKKTHSNEKPFGCTLCDRRFKTNGALNRHFRSHTREKHYKCSVCSETFFYAHQRQIHLSVVHTGKPLFVCPDCGRSFTFAGSLTRHLRIHRDEKPFECNICNKRFRQGNQVRAHKETHGEKPYVCWCCGKRLGLGSFWTHMKEHTSVKISYECAVCDKKLSTKKTLEMHTRLVHMGEPYVCDICHKEFRKQKDFQLHKKEHNNCSS